MSTLARSGYAKLIWHALALFVVVVWGTTFISTKLLLASLTPIEILLYRSVIAYGILFVLSPRISRPQGLRTELTYLLAAISGLTLYFVCENNALRWTYTSNVSLIVSTAPLISALVAPVFVRTEQWTRNTILGGVVSFVGVGFIVTNSSLVLALNPLGNLLAFLSAVAWAAFPIALSRINDSLDKITRMRKIFFYGIATTLVYMFAFDEELMNANVFRVPVAENLAFLGVVASALCYVVWSQAVIRLGVGNTIMYMYFVPIVTMFVGSIVLREQITTLMVIGAVLILGGVAIKNMGRQEPFITS